MSMSCAEKGDLLKLMVWQCIPLELSVLGVSDETIETSGRLQSKHHFFISCDEKKNPVVRRERSGATGIHIPHELWGATKRFCWD